MHDGKGIHIIQRPYLGRSRREIRDQILARQAQIKRHEIPQGWTLQAADFINKLLQRKPLNRLGLNGPNELKSHPWLKDFNFTDLFDMKMRSPFIPSSKEDNIDIKNVSENWKDDEQVIKQNVMLLKQPNIQMLFKDYYYDYTSTNSNLTAHTTAQQSTAEEKPDKTNKENPKTQSTLAISSKSSANHSALSNSNRK